ncbi:MAG: hypothetical protein LW834_01260 [Cyanobium sp. 49614_E6]|jgi:hypothetical protein|nr:hypothetical protein [Cyanobium sp. 49614_E6]
MAKIIYDSFLPDMAAGNCNTIHAFKGILTSAGYSANRATHAKRSDVTNEISGPGYSAGGAPVTLSVSVNTTTHVVTITVGPTTWANSSLTAKQLVVARARGGAANLDELVCCIDNGTDVTSSNGTLTFPGATWTIPLPAPV